MAMTKEEAETISWNLRKMADEVDAMVQDTEKSKAETDGIGSDEEIGLNKKKPVEPETTSPTPTQSTGENAGDTAPAGDIAPVGDTAPAGDTAPSGNTGSSSPKNKKCFVDGCNGKIFNKINEAHVCKKHFFSSFR